MTRAHARLAPSSASRWMRCPGSVDACIDEPNESSEFAALGTAAHEIAEECLLLGFEARQFVGHMIRVEDFVFEVTQEMADYLQPGLDRIWELCANGRLYVETAVSTARWCGPGNFGTLDRGIILPDMIVIGDLKYGEGVPISPVKNEQLMLYALAFWDQIARHLTKAEKFLLIVDQPRIPGSGGEWEVSLADLLKFGEEVAEAAAATLKKGAPRIPGDIQCHWCAKATPSGCPEWNRWNAEMILSNFEEIDNPISVAPDLPKVITPERRSYIVRHRSMIDKWLDMLHAEALSDALSGKPVPGLKAVRGRRPARKWSSEDEVSSLLEARGVPHDKRYKYSLVSPTSAEKAFERALWEDLRAFVEQGDGNPVLVPEDDEREAIAPAIEALAVIDR